MGHDASRLRRLGFHGLRFVLGIALGLLTVKVKKVKARQESLLRLGKATESDRKHTLQEPRRRLSATIRAKVPKNQTLRR
jgi:hypothetical protein